MSSPDPNYTTLLKDAPSRDYAEKLRRFNEFAETELRLAIASLRLTPGARVLDIGCGSGEALRWFHEIVTNQGLVAGLDLSAGHVTAARAIAPPGVTVEQGDLMRPPFPAQSFDLVWCVNTINHVAKPAEGITALKALLRDGGRIALGQSHFLPEMYLAWDARLERVITEAIRRFYRERYGLDERDLAPVRNLVGLLQRAGLRNVAARTFVIERTQPLSPETERYLAEVLFREASPERLRPYLSDDDFGQLTRLIDPAHEEFAVRRRDFHFLQTFTLVVGSL